MDEPEYMLREAQGVEEEVVERAWPVAALESTGSSTYWATEQRRRAANVAIPSTLEASVD